MVFHPLARGSSLFEGVCKEGRCDRVDIDVRSVGEDGRDVGYNRCMTLSKFVGEFVIRVNGIGHIEKIRIKVGMNARSDGTNDVAREGF